MWGKCMKKKTPAANLLRQAIQFIGISGIGWLMDFTIFSLLGLCSANLTINNIISSSVAVSFVFVVSTCKTFVQKNGGMNLKIKFAIYVTYQIVLIFVISRLLALLAVLISAILIETAFAKFSGMLAKILVTPFTMCANFFVMKFLIERI